MKTRNAKIVDYEEPLKSSVLKYIFPSEAGDAYIYGGRTSREKAFSYSQDRLQLADDQLARLNLGKAAYPHGFGSGSFLQDDGFFHFRFMHPEGISENILKKLDEALVECFSRKGLEVYCHQYKDQEYGRRASEQVCSLSFQLKNPKIGLVVDDKDIDTAMVLLETVKEIYQAAVEQNIQQKNAHIK